MSPEYRVHLPYAQGLVKVLVMRNLSESFSPILYNVKIGSTEEFAFNVIVVEPNLTAV